MRTCTCDVCKKPMGFSSYKAGRQLFVRMARDHFGMSDSDIVAFLESDCEFNSWTELEQWAKERRPVGEGRKNKSTN